MKFVDKFTSLLYGAGIFMRLSKLINKQYFLSELLYDATKPVFGVYDKMRFKPACSATKTS